jgi:hypothetical protein
MATAPAVPCLVAALARSPRRRGWTLDTGQAGLVASGPATYPRDRKLATQVPECLAQAVNRGGHLVYARTGARAAGEVLGGVGEPGLIDHARHRLTVS